MITVKEYAELLEEYSDKLKDSKITAIYTSYKPEDGGIWRVGIVYNTGNYLESDINGEFSRPELASHSFIMDDCNIENIRRFIDFKIKEGEI